MSGVILKFSALQFIEQGRLTSGPYAGGYLVAPAGELNWYFANLGLVPFVSRIRAEVAQYIDLYLASLTPEAKIQDVLFSADPNSPTTTPSDSDDSYAATLLSLVSAYVRAPTDNQWFNSRLPKLLVIAERNLIHNRYRNGLTYPFQNEAQY